MTEWPTERLKHLARISFSNVDKKSVEGQLPVRLCNYTDVYYRDAITSEIDFMEATATNEQLRAFALRRGDVLITKDSETADDIAVPAYVAENLPGVLCGYHLALVRPDLRRVDGRFLYWAMASERTRRQAEVLASGVTRYGLRADSVGNFELLVPQLKAQRAIADFLDRETARIDGLIEKRQRLVALVTSRLDATAAAILVEAGKRSSDHNAQLPGELASAWPVLTLRQAGVTVCTGPFGTQFSADEYVSDGIPMINPTHIKNGRVQPDPEATVSPLTAKRLDRHRAAIGDVVLGRKGDVGRSALITAHEEGWLVGSDSIAIRTARSSLRPEYLSALLQLTVIRQQLEAHSTGATLANVNESILLNLRVPVPPLRRQDKLYERYARVASSHASLRQKVELQIGLLREHRQALVTAAVMGQINVRAA